jgi:hypothetical protein
MSLKVHTSPVVIDLAQRIAPVAMSSARMDST